MDDLAAAPRSVLGEDDSDQLHDVERGDALELEARGQFALLFEYLRREAQDEEIHEVERGIFVRLLGLGLTLLKYFLAQKGTGRSDSVRLVDGSVVPYHSVKHRTYFSVFGKLVIDRAYYWASGLAAAFPIDATLNLPERCYSYLLREWAEFFGVEHAFDKVTDALEAVLRIKLWKRSVVQIARDAAPAVQGVCEEKAAPATGAEGELLVAAIDGKGVPIRRSEPRPKKLRVGSGEKPNKKKESIVSAVYTIDCHFREPKDILRQINDDATVVPPDHELPPRPKPKNKRVRATLKGKDSAFKEVQRQFEERDPEGKKERVVLTDGDDALQERALANLAGPNDKLTLILDIMHVLDYVWDAAYAFHAAGSADASRWVMNKLRLLLEGKVGYVIGALKQSLTKRSFPRHKREAINKAIGYMTRNRDYMQYDAFLDMGYPIGTGVAEGACRNLVRDRMELTGMRWSIDGAQAVLELRAVKINGDWEQFWEHRVRQERKRLYGEKAGTPAGIRKAG